MALQTEFDFTLPKGYIDRDGVLHRHGTMRLATARDEIEPLRDPRVTGSDDPFLTILVIARVVKELGGVPSVTADVVENLFAADLAFLQDLYGIINFGNPADVAALQQAVLGDDDRADDGFGVAHVEPMSAPSTSAPVENRTESDLDAQPRRRGRIEEVGSHAGP